jgi:hypothetical protein
MVRWVWCEMERHALREMDEFQVSGAPVERAPAERMLGMRA